MDIKYSTNGQPISVIQAGPEDAPVLMMLHGGPGYYWPEKEIIDLAEKLATAKTDLNIQAIQGRGCGAGNFISPYKDLTDDNLFKRAEDLKSFPNPKILLGHSAGVMVALTAIMEGFIQPEQVVLLSPYTASLGEHDYWVSKKADKYPAAFGRYLEFMEKHWKKYHGQVPDDLKENLYIYWGELFFALNDDEKLKANLHYLDFHVIESSPQIGMENGEPYTNYKLLLETTDQMDNDTKAVLLRIGTINAHWWKTNFQDGYSFLEKLKQFSFNMPIHILSGDKDEITPPETVEKLAAILKTKAVIAKDSRHMPETKMPGELKSNVVSLLQKIAV